MQSPFFIPLNSRKKQFRPLQNLRYQRSIKNGGQCLRAIFYPSFAHGKCQWGLPFLMESFLIFEVVCFVWSDGKKGKIRGPWCHRGDRLSRPRPQIHICVLGKVASDTMKSWKTDPFSSNFHFVLSWHFAKRCFAFSLAHKSGIFRVINQPR